VDHILSKAPGLESPPTAVAEKQDLLKRLLGKLAHEIRNPLSSLDVHVQLLEEDLGELAPQVRDRLAGRLGIIQGELHRLESVVSQFLRLAGPSALDLEPVELRGLVDHVCGLMRPEAGVRNIELESAVAEGQFRYLADSVRLTQALLNLVINAMQAIERDGRIQIKLDHEGARVCVSVHDTGPGIPSEKLGSIFDPYFTTKLEGHGLGLWIAQQIIVAHGGQLTAQNATERGAVFKMILPLSPVD
jgi:two-component system sensor histidine kinase HydH